MSALRGDLPPRGGDCKGCLVNVGQTRCQSEISQVWSITSCPKARVGAASTIPEALGRVKRAGGTVALFGPVKLGVPGDHPARVAKCQIAQFDAVAVHHPSPCGPNGRRHAPAKRDPPALRPLPASGIGGSEGETEGAMSIDKQSEIAANLQIGPTTLGMVRIYVEGEGVDLPLDFEPEEAEEIAEELLAAARMAREMGSPRPQGGARKPRR